ncbi:MAG: phage holin family protein, partial [Paenisporosarcina sp.]
WFFYIIGGWESLMTVLLVFMVIDIFTGLIKAAIKRKLNSKIGYKGFLKKAAIMLVIILANWLDALTTNDVPAFKTIALYFYIGMEGLSIVENLHHIGVPIPKVISKYMANLAQVENDENKKE